jgi:hypothetical protein
MSMGLGLDLSLCARRRAAVAPTIPASQTVSFGAKTRVGFEGNPLGYTGAGTLTITAGNSTGHWQIDNRNHLVPKNAAGAYGSAPPTFSGPYTLTIGDGTVSTFVTVNMVARRAGFREMTSTPGGVNQDNPAADTAFGPPYQSQLNYYTDKFILADGDHIVMRDGHLNPSGAIWYMSYHASYVGLRLTIESETVEAVTRLHGGKIGQLLHSPATPGASYPVEFKNLQITNDTGVASLFQQGSGGIIAGLLMTDCQVGYGPSVTKETMGADSLYGIQCDGVTVRGTRFTHVGSAIVGNSIQSFANDFDTLYIDQHSMDGPDNVIVGAFCRDVPGIVDNHPDTAQHQGFVGSGQMITMQGCVWAGDDNICIQGPFLTNQQATLAYTGAEVTHCINFMCGLNALDFSSVSNVRANYNTILMDVTKYPLGVDPDLIAKFYVPHALPQPSGGEFIRNIANFFELSWQTGATITPASQCVILPTVAAYNTAFPYLVAMLTAGIETYDEGLQAATPYNLARSSGGVMEADGTANGALFPAVAPEVIGAWNDGSVYAPLDATWLAAHPRATRPTTLAVVTNAILLESGSYLLLESGSKLLKE